MPKILSEAFFNRDTEIVARDLLGKFLVREIGKKQVSGMITETEAYDGFEDKASHAFRGKTLRTEVMFGKPGYGYVYFTYGMHFLVNVVTREHGYPAAVLIRGIKLEDGKLLDGPAKLTKFLAIDKSLNKKKAAKLTGLWLEDRGVRIAKNTIQKSARIGVAYAGPVWSAKKRRFYLSI